MVQEKPLYKGTERSSIHDE